jgi:hypothetical protein
MSTPFTTFTTAFLSTAHLSPETCAQLDEWCRAIDLDRRREYSKAPLMVGATDTGWFVNACVEERGPIPRDLWHCMRFVQRHGCDIIQFDSEGDEADGLPNLGGPRRLEPA